MSRRARNPPDGCLLLVIVVMCVVLHYLLGALYAMLVYWRSL